MLNVELQPSSMWCQRAQDTLPTGVVDHWTTLTDGVDSGAGSMRVSANRMCPAAMANNGMLKKSMVHLRTEDLECRAMPQCGGPICSYALTHPPSIAVVKMRLKLISTSAPAVATSLSFRLPACVPMQRQTALLCAPTHKFKTEIVLRETWF